MDLQQTRLELESIKAEADAKLELLQDEIQAISVELSDTKKECSVKAKAVNDLKAEAAANEQKARNDATVQQTEIQRLTEYNSAKAQSVLQLEQSLITLRNELTEGSMKKMENLRLQMSRSHAQEIDLLKSRHESHIREAAELATEQEELAVDNAVTRVKLEYEAKLSHQIDTSSRDLQINHLFLLFDLKSPSSSPPTPSFNSSSSSKRIISFNISLRSTAKRFSTRAAYMFDVATLTISFE